ncbi:MAG TPA: VCBS repeat-containing protein, partial [bacterium]|nr:VCBS repeat-containing protein [bacterium]HPQ65363.1 VCBS repeat-containing protein [bacterium]
GDGTTDLTVYRSSLARWLIFGAGFVRWGVVGGTDIPATGDFFLDGSNDPTIFRQGRGRWFIYDPASPERYDIGAPGDIPMTGKSY